MGSITCNTPSPQQIFWQSATVAPDNPEISPAVADLQVSLPPIQGKVSVRRRRVVDGKIHFYQNIAKHPQTGVYLYRFSYRGRIHAGSTGCYRVSEARDVVNALKGKFSLEGVGIKKQKVLTLRQAYEIWMVERAPQRSKGYVSTLSGSMKNHILPLIGGLQLSEIDSTAISTVLNSYLEKFAASGANSVGLHISALLSFGIEKKWIKERPKVSKIPVQKRVRPIITNEGSSGKS